jgi:hypothetical protein
LYFLTFVLTFQAYVEQNDNFYSMLTVAETLTMSSQLQLSPSTSAEDKHAYVDNLISVLGLAKVRLAFGDADMLLLSRTVCLVNSQCVHVEDFLCRDLMLYDKRCVC